MTYFSENLKFLREERNLSQQEIANILEINQRTYSNYERGRTEPSLDLLLKFSKFFRTSLDMLVGVALGVVTSADKEQVEKAKELYNAPTNAKLAKKMFHQAFVAGVADVQGRETPIVYPEFEEVVKNPDLYKEKK